jgi:hypothetical protein
VCEPYARALARTLLGQRTSVELSIQKGSISRPFPSGACRDRTGDLQLAKRGQRRIVEPFPHNKAEIVPLQPARIRSGRGVTGAQLARWRISSSAETAASCCPSNATAQRRSSSRDSFQAGAHAARITVGLTGYGRSRSAAFDALAARARPLHVFEAASEEAVGKVCRRAGLAPGGLSRPWSEATGRGGAKSR